MAPPIHIRLEAPIKASAEATWNKLIDTSTWPEWNPFVPEATVVDASGAAHSSQVLKLDSLIDFVPVLNGKKYPTKQKVTVFEQPSSDEGKKIYRVSWATQSYPSLLLSTHRFNEIEEVNASECIYRTGEDQWGPLAYITKMLFGTLVEQGIRDWVNGLKQIMEKSKSRDLADAERVQPRAKKKKLIHAPISNMKPMLMACSIFLIISRQMIISSATASEG